MSKKNLSESITEAWNAAVETGRKQDEIKEQREREVDVVFCDVHERIMQHLVEQEETEEEKETRRKKREELQAQRAISDGQRAQQTQTGQTISNRPETSVAALDQRPKATPGSEEYSRRGGSARDIQTRRGIDALDITTGEKQARKGILSRAQADPDERRRFNRMGDDELRSEIESQQLADVRTARLERDKDKIAAGDMDSEGRMTRQGREKRLSGQQRMVARRVQRLENEISRLSALDDGRDRSGIIGRKRAEIAALRGNMAGARLRFDQDVESGKIGPAAATGDTTGDTTTGDTTTGDTTGTPGYRAGQATGQAIETGAKTGSENVYDYVAGLFGGDSYQERMRPDSYSVSPEGEFSGPMTDPLKNPKSVGDIIQGIADYYMGVDLEMERGKKAIQGTVPAIRAAQAKTTAKLDAAYETRPNVPAGVYPFEDENYKRWFSTLGDAEKNMEIQRVQEKPGDPLASAPPDPSKPPPTVGS